MVAEVSAGLEVRESFLRVEAYNMRAISQVGKQSLWSRRMEQQR